MTELPLSLDYQIRKLTEVLAELVRSTGKRSFPYAALEQMFYGRYAYIGSVTFSRLQDGFDLLQKTGKIVLREAPEGKMVDITHRFAEMPKLEFKIEFDREIQKRYQLDLKKIEEAHALLYQLENRLREFIVSELGRFDSNWLNKCIDGNIRKKWESRKEIEMKARWRRPVEHELIYYSDISDLMTIVTNDTNWEKVFKKFFVKKETIIRLNELESVRHTIAHNRMISDEDLTRLKLLHDEILSCLKVQ